jgi:hypothetical protein
LVRFRCNGRFDVKHDVGGTPGIYEGRRRDDAGWSVPSSINCGPRTQYRSLLSTTMRDDVAFHFCGNPTLEYATYRAVIVEDQLEEAGH